MKTGSAATPPVRRLLLAIALIATCGAVLAQEDFDTPGRFFKEKMINGRLTSADGPIKTFPLQGIKDSPPYLHDGPLMALEDTVEFFNLVLGIQLAVDEKTDLVAFLRTL